MNDLESFNVPEVSVRGEYGGTIAERACRDNDITSGDHFALPIKTQRKLGRMASVFS